ncbi:MAG: hypothetical protein SF051_14050 [Elusimicrobiota bacterium]|nr:hypothetical protein [Elusimicrobiota bacterium]
MKTLKTALALLLAALNASQASANAAARAAGRARVPATTAVVVAPLRVPALELRSPILSAPAPSRLDAGSPASADAPRPALAPAWAPAPADAPRAPADAPRAQAADLGWLGDHEDVLLNGTEQEVAQIEALLAAGRISPQHPGSEAERRALGIVRGVTNDWTPRMLESAVRAGTPKPAELSWYTRQTLARADRDLREARRHAAGPLESLALGARALLARTSAPRGEEGVVAWLERVSRRSLGGRRAVAEGLAARIPGADPKRAIIGDERLRVYGKSWGGYTPYNVVEDGGPSSAFTWMARGRESKFFHAAAHEFWHQSDKGYAAAETALRLVVHDAAPALATALLEGHTELRARRTLEALYAEGAAGEGGLPARYRRALRARHGGTDATAWEREQAVWRGQAYHPFVRFAEAVESLPGGRAALDAFASRGAVQDLVAVLGEGRLRGLAIALAPPPARFGDATRETYAAFGFDFLFETLLARIASGSLDADGLRRLKQDAVSLSADAAQALRAKAGRRPKLDRLLDSGVARDLGRGAPRESLAPRVDAALAGRLTDLLPRPASSEVAAFGRQVLLPTAAGALAFGLGLPLWTVPLALLAGYELGDLWNAATVVVAPDARVPVLLGKGAGPTVDLDASAMRWRAARAPAPVAPQDRAQRAVRALAADGVPESITRLFGTGPYGSDMIAAWRRENPGRAMPDDYIQLDLDERGYRESWTRPRWLAAIEVKAEARFALFRDDVFVNEYYKQHLDAESPSRAPVDTRWWARLIDGQPWLEWDAARGTYAVRRGGAQARLLRSLRSAGGGARTVTLYRGTTPEEVRFLKMVGILGRGRRAEAVAIARELARRDDMDAGLAATLARFIAGRGSDRMWRRELLRSVASASAAAWGNGAFFTTTRAEGAQGFAKGAVARFEVEHRALERLSRDRGLFVGVEFDLELAFRGEAGLAVLADALAGEIPVDASGGKIMSTPEDGRHPVWGSGDAREGATR